MMTHHSQSSPNLHPFFKQKFIRLPRLSDTSLHIFQKQLQQIFPVINTCNQKRSIKPVK